jgi:hypothetical protein
MIPRDDINIAYIPRGEPSRTASKDSYKRYEEQMKMREVPVQKLIPPEQGIDENYSTPIKRLTRLPPPPQRTPPKPLNDEETVDESLIDTVAVPTLRIFDQLPSIYQVIHKYGLHVSRDEIEQLINQYGLTLDSSVTKQMFNSILVEIVNIHKRKMTIGTSMPPPPPVMPEPSYTSLPPAPPDMTFEIKRAPIKAPVRQVEPDNFRQVSKYCISSSERNMETWPIPNEFQVPLKSPPNMVVREFRLVSCIFPKTTQGDSIEDMPFLVLDIKEVGTVISKQDGQKYGFCHMIFEKDIGKFKVFNNDSPDNRKVLYPPVHIETLTVSISKPDGSLFQFIPLKQIPPKVEKRVTFNLSYDPDPLKPIEAPVAPDPNPEPTTATDDAYAPITFVFEVVYQRRGG